MIACRYVKVDGASCSLNDNCQYPNCTKEENKEE